MHNPSHLAITTNGGVVLDLKHDRLLKLNSVGAEMWTLLSRGMSETQVVDKVAQQYGVDPSRVAEDLRTFLRRAKELGVSPESVSIGEPRDQTGSKEEEPSSRALEQHQRASNAV